MTTLKTKTISSIRWVFIATLVQRVIQFGTTVVLARILSPADYGLFALAFVLIDGFALFKSLGVDSALVRRKENPEIAFNTSFILIPAIGFAIFILVYLLAPVGAQFMNNPQITNIVRVIAIVYVVSCIGKVPQTILYREMKFKYKTIAEISSGVVYSSTALILALNKFGVWSLVVAYVLKNIIQVSIEWHYAKWTPKLEFDKKIAWEMFHFGKYVLGSSVILFMYNNMDNFIIGKFLGVTALGYYALAKSTTNLLNDYILGKVGMIMYPVYSKIQDNNAELKRIILKMLRYLSILAIPFSVCLIIFAPEGLRIVFGEKWLPATNILRILAISGVMNSISVAIWPAFLALGQSKTDFQLSFVNLGVFLLLVIPLSLKWQLNGVGLAVLISTVISFIMGIARAKKIISITINDLLQALAPALCCSALMICCAFLLRFIKISPNMHINFLIIAAVSIGMYSIAVYFFDKQIIKNIKEMII